jgi:uncharacterized RDD family membrane protein YckC
MPTTDFPEGFCPMTYDLQKASMLKRLSAFILDFILLVVLITGFAWSLSAALNYDHYSNTLQDCYGRYEQEYGIDIDITAEEFNSLSKEEQQKYYDANKALGADKEAQYAYNMLINLTLVITSLSVLLGYLALEFLVPMLFGNGQTVGKKVFAIAVMRTHGVKVNGICLFIRTILGKCAIETMIPLFILIMMFFGTIDIFSLAILAILVIAQLATIVVTPTNSALHDKLADTVAVDMSSQLIFESDLARTAYQKKIAAEKASKQSY